MKTFVFASALLLFTSTIAFAQNETVAPNENLAVEGVPTIPASLAASVEHYGNYRGAGLASWNPEKREFDYSFRPASMRPVSEYLKLQGRFGHLRAEHIANLQKFANEQWKMMGVQLPEALIKAADPKNQTNMAAAAEAVTIAETV